MSTAVTLPPENGLRPDGTLAGGWWHRSADDDRVVCDLCPRECHLKPGDRGFCFVRQNVDGQMVLDTYGKSTGFCIDPIEKKPLNHFWPGTSVLSFGTAGCNLGCKFCQNWDISKSREVQRLSESATPETIASAARSLGCRSVAFTYNDPVIWAEYAIDTARECRALGIQSVAVTAGYISPIARPAFFHAMDAANVDLKAFTEEFYYKVTYSHLQPVLDTLEWLKKESDVWFEVANLVIPDANDSLDEIRQMCDWILARVGPDVPVHFTAFHPDFRMRDRPRTPHETLLAAREIAVRQGLHFAYVGNVNDVRNQSTYCPGCGGLLIERNWYELGAYHLRGNQCAHCGQRIAGHFDERPGHWGRQRVPVRIADYARPEPVNVYPLRVPAMPPAASAAPLNDAVTVCPELSDEQRQAVFGAAAEFVAAEIHQRPARLADADLAGAASLPVMGAFVTLKRGGRLRGCCGSLGRPMPIVEAVRAAATRTATQDVRLPPVSPTELVHLELDVTLLFNFHPMTARGADRAAAVRVGRHGLQIRRGEQSGLLLPSVPVENGWDAHTFLAQVCRKAGLPVTAWQDDETEITLFEGNMVHGAFPAAQLDAADGQTRELFSHRDLARLAAACRDNVLALARGATPNYYLAGCPDGTVAGAAIELRWPGALDKPHFYRISLRPGLPLQSTLFQLCESAGGLLRDRQVVGNQLNGASLGLTVLYDPAMHGTVAEPDLAGIEPARRAVLVMEQTKTAWCFDRAVSAAELLAHAARDAQVAAPESAAVYSLAVLSTDAGVAVSSVPQPQSGDEVRPPAVAGMFYPANADELSRLVDNQLGDLPAVRESWPAVMVPHAGLIYSGPVAAAVFRRLEIPPTVIVIGPKHTRLGVEWSVAPNAAWRIPGATVASDPALAKRLADAIPGLQLDAAAHQREHGIEVELPFLARLAPQSRVVGIAIGAGNLDRCRQFAAGLAQVLRELDPRPLLVISSDMNHYAADPENRRLDEMAIAALERLDPEHAFQTIVGNAISMCGVLPAVIVMETLRLLGQLETCQRVAYATSADVSRDTSRVVGYAGLLFGNNHS